MPQFCCVAGCCDIMHRPSSRKRNRSSLALILFVVACAVVGVRAQNNRSRTGGRRVIKQKQRQQQPSKSNNVFHRKNEKGNNDNSTLTKGRKPVEPSGSRSKQNKKRSSATAREPKKTVRNRGPTNKEEDSISLASLRSSTTLRSTPNLLALVSKEEESGEIDGSCWLNQSGSYGDLVAAQSEGGKSYIIEFNYQASVKQGSSPVQISQVVVPAVDRAVAQSILKDFFPCKTFEAPNTRNLQNNAILALSSMPLDRFVAARSSCPNAMVATDCYLARGAVTVVAKDVFNVAALENLIMAASNSAFQSGTVLENVDSDLVQDVAFLSDGFNDGSPIAPNTPVTFSPIAVFPIPVSFPTQMPKNDSPTVTQPSTTIRPSPNPTLIPTRGPAANQTTATPSTTDFPSSVIPPSNITTATPNVAPPQEEKKRRSRWWIWLLVGVGGVLVFVFLLTLCEEVDKTSVHPSSRKKNRSEDSDDKFGSVYVPPTDAAQAAAAHLRKSRKVTNASPSDPEQAPQNRTQASTDMFVNDSDESDTDSGVRRNESYEDEGTYGNEEDTYDNHDPFDPRTDLVEIVEEEEEEFEETVYVEEEVSEGGEAWADVQEESYGSTY